MGLRHEPRMQQGTLSLNRETRVLKGRREVFWESDNGAGPLPLVELRLCWSPLGLAQIRGEAVAKLVAARAAGYFCGFRGGLWRRKRGREHLQGVGGGAGPSECRETSDPALQPWALRTALCWAVSDPEELPPPSRLPHLPQVRNTNTCKTHHPCY